MSFNNVEVTLRLESPRYYAFERILHEYGTDLEQLMQNCLEEVYAECVPDFERMKISNMMEAAELSEEAARELNLRITAYRIIENGQESCFVEERPMDFLDMAELLRRYLLGGLHSESVRFEDYFKKSRQLTENDFSEYAQKRMEDPQRVAGVYHVDFDKQEVSLVDVSQGWQIYQLQDVSSAVFAASLKEWIDRGKRWSKFWKLLKGNELTPRQELKPDCRPSVFRVTEDGNSTCFMVKEKTRALQVANHLRNYICIPQRNGSPTQFVDMFSSKKEISGEQYDTLVKERVDDTGQVAGAYNIDLDKGTFGIATTKSGWDFNPIRDVTAAAYHALRRRFFSWDERWKEYMYHLNSKQIERDEERYFYLSGSRELHAEDICFEGDLVEDGGLLEFHMEVIFDPDEVLGAEVHTDDEESYINVHAYYDMENQYVRDTLVVRLVDDEEEEYEYPLSEEERSLLLTAMEIYCQQSYGLGLEEWREYYLRGEAQIPLDIVM